MDCFDSRHGGVFSPQAWQGQPWPGQNYQGVFTQDREVGVSEVGVGDVAGPRIRPLLRHALHVAISGTGGDNAQ